MPQDIVIIPTYFRPEYLALCLEHIQAARATRDLVIQVYHDKPRRSVGANTNESREVCFDFPVTFIEREDHTAVGNTYNFLDAYLQAAASKARYVYLIEDDVLVGPDFFHWHEAVQARSDYFCSVAWHDIRNPNTKATDDPHALVESAIDFSSIGVCWKREALAAVVEHATRQYYNNPTDYLWHAFPESPIPCTRWVEQAGLIMRVLLEGRGKRVVAWAGRPRCAHIGVNGYHRLRGPKHTPDSLRKALSDGSFFASASTMFDDINPLPAFLPWTPEKMYVSQKF